MLIVAPPHPSALVLGPEVDEEEHAPPLDRLGELRHEDVARPVDPVEIVDQDDKGLALAEPLDQAPEEAQQLSLLRLRIDSRRWILRIRHAEELEQQRQRVAEALVEKQQRAGDLSPRFVVRVLLADSEVRAPELEDR